MRQIKYLSLALIFLASCGEKTIDKKDQLIALKKQRADIDLKIETLEKELSKTDSVKATAVAIAVLQPQNFTSYIEVQGQIIGDENVLATSQSPGVVKDILVHVGQRVSKGQTLALLDASVIKQSLQTLDAQLSLAKELYEKQQKLWEQNIGSQVQLLQAKTNYESLLSQRKTAGAQKDMYAIKSPIDGVVDAMSLKVGDAVAPGFSGIHVTSHDKLKAVASLGENYIGKVKENDNTLLVFRDLNDSIKTHLSYVAQSVDVVSRAFNVEVKLGSNSKLRPNMSCIMKIANYQNKKALVVPVAAIQKTAEGEMVYIANGEVAQSKIIQTGRNSNGDVEVLSGLNEGDKVIVAGYEDLENGERISVK